MRKLNLALFNSGDMLPVLLHRPLLFKPPQSLHHLPSHQRAVRLLQLELNILSLLLHSDNDSGKNRSPLTLPAFFYFLFHERVLL
jgi:hypothetical protein